MSDLQKWIVCLLDASGDHFARDCPEGGKGKGKSKSKAELFYL